MGALDMILANAETSCPDIKVLYTLWLGMLTIEVMDTRTGETHSRTFPDASGAVQDWLVGLQEGV